MSDIEFKCKHCDGHLVVDARGAGKIVPCPFCRQEVLIPVPQPINTSVPLNPLPPPLNGKRVLPVKSHRWIWVTLLIVFIVIALPVSIVLIKPMLFQKKLKSELCWLIEQQRDDGWWAFHWGMDSAQVKRVLTRDTIELDDGALYGWVPKCGYGKDCFDVYFYFNKISKGLERVQVCANPMLVPRAIVPEYYKDLYGILQGIMTNKYGVPQYGDEMLKGNKFGILRGNGWDVGKSYNVDLIEEPRKTAVFFSNRNGDEGGSVVFNIMMNSHAADEKQRELRVKEQRRAYKSEHATEQVREEPLNIAVISDVHKYGWNKFNWQMTRERLIKALQPETKVESKDFRSENDLSWVHGGKWVKICNLNCQINIAFDGYSELTSKLSISFATLFDPPGTTEKLREYVFQQLRREIGEDGVSGTEKKYQRDSPCTIWRKGNTKVILFADEILYEYVRASGQ
jgi:hypothetical protein